MLRGLRGSSSLEPVCQWGSAGGSQDPPFLCPVGPVGQRQPAAHTGMVSQGENTAATPAEAGVLSSAIIHRKLPFIVQYPLKLWLQIITITFKLGEPLPPPPPISFGGTNAGRICSQRLDLTASRSCAWVHDEEEPWPLALHGDPPPSPPKRRILWVSCPPGLLSCVCSGRPIHNTSVKSHVILGTEEVVKAGIYSHCCVPDTLPRFYEYLLI